MKVLALSNVEGVLDEVVDELSEAHATVMGKEFGGDTAAFCAAIEDALLKKNYDMVLGITDDYLTAEMALNKKRDIRAARCSSRSDLSSARRNDANVILIGPHSSILKDIAKVLEPAEPDAVAPKQKRIKEKEAYAPKSAPAMREEPEERAVGRPIGAGVLNFLGEKRRKFGRKNDDEEQDSEDYEDTGPARSGMVGKFKDALGIVDEKK